MQNLKIEITDASVLFICMAAVLIAIVIGDSIERKNKNRNKK